VYTPPLPRMTRRSVGLQADKKTGGLKTASTASAGLERALMERVHRDWGALLQEACKYSSIPLEFIAALIANESGGNPDARRFEPGVFKHLQAVRDGREPRYGSLRAEDLRTPRPDAAGHRPALQPFSDDELRALATSWGLTQIMGYHCLSWERQPGDLLDPKFNLGLAVRLATHFIEAFQLDVRRDGGGDYEGLFRCWNSGAPRDDPKTTRLEGKTFDPHYAERGLARMAIYRELSAVHSPLSTVHCRVGVEGTDL